MDEQLRANATKMLDVLDRSGVKPIMEMGIKGQKANARHCLVAKYLEQTVGGEWWVGCFTATDQRVADAKDQVVLPAGVRQMIADFDLGLYPFLEEPVTTPSVETTKNIKAGKTKHIRCCSPNWERGLCGCGERPTGQSVPMGHPLACQVCTDLWFSGHLVDCPRTHGSWQWESP